MMLLISLIFVFLLSTPKETLGWQSAFMGRRHGGPTSASATTWTMRDASTSYWFRVGDRVQVLEDVIKAGVSLKGNRGVVVETWEKCDVDPTCCCAEQVDLGMAVRVEFSAGASGGKEADDSRFFHYFAETELMQVKEEEEKKNLAFDGMTCTAFKMQQLQVHQSQPRGIASFEPKRASYEETS